MDDKDNELSIEEIFNKFEHRIAKNGQITFLPMEIILPNSFENEIQIRLLFGRLEQYEFAFHHIVLDKYFGKFHIWDIRMQTLLECSINGNLIAITSKIREEGIVSAIRLYNILKVFYLGTTFSVRKMDD